MKKLLLSTLCILALVGCSSKKEAVIEPTSSSETVEIPTPFIEVSSLEEAIQEAGFDLTIPDELNGISPTLFLVYNQDLNMIEVRYEKDDQVTIIRKNKGITENISGDYNTYSNTYTVTENDLEISFRANDDLVYVGEWNKDDYSYSLSVSSGLSEEAFIELIHSIN